MELPEKLEKGKGKVAAMTEDPMDDDEDESAEDTEVGRRSFTLNM